MKKIFLNFSSLAALAIAVVTLPSCLKSNDSTFTDFSTAGQTVSLLNAGLGNFKASNISPFVPQSFIDVELTVQLNGEFPANDATNVVLEVDDAKRVAYNASQSIQFGLLPTKTYKFLGSLNLVIEAGKRLAKTTVRFYPDSIKTYPPDTSFLFPVSMKSAGGKLIASNFQTMYINVIGNPIAGPYLWDFKRWNVTTGLSSAEPASAPNGGTFVGTATNFVPKDGSTILVPSGYFIQPNYEISFTNNGGVLSNFKAIISAADNDALIAAGVTVVDGPNVLLANPTTKEYRLQYQVFNGTAWRYMWERYYK